MEMKYFIEYSNTSGTDPATGRISAYLEAVLKS